MHWLYTVLLLPVADCYRLVAACSVPLGSGLDLLQEVMARPNATLASSAAFPLSQLLRSHVWLKLSQQDDQQCGGKAGASQLLRLLETTVAKPERVVRLLTVVCELFQLVRQGAGKLERWHALSLIHMALLKPGRVLQI